MITKARIARELLAEILAFCKATGTSKAEFQKLLDTKYDVGRRLKEECSITTELIERCNTVFASQCWLTRQMLKEHVAEAADLLDREPNATNRDSLKMALNMWRGWPHKVG